MIWKIRQVGTVASCSTSWMRSTVALKGTYRDKDPSIKEKEDASRRGGGGGDFIDKFFGFTQQELGTEASRMLEPSI